MKILVGEDDSITRMAIADALRAAGHEVVEARDGVEVVDAHDRELPDALVLDERMPRRSGLDAAVDILARRSVPVVLVTAYSDCDTRRAAAEAGIHGYLVKPVAGGDVLPALEVARAAVDREQALEQEAETARVALADRKVIERAKGLLMDRAGLTEGEAYQRLQGRARRENRRMVEIARAVLVAEDLLGLGDAP